MCSLSLVYQQQAHSELRTLAEMNYKSVHGKKKKKKVISILFAELYILLGFEKHCFGFPI